ncbi:MAG: OmpA family protein [Betaproteobacteria bacterium]|nr:OmpA family protein [Betaproteobacteria bacterium]
MTTVLNIRFIAAATLTALTLSGCANMSQTQRDTATGAGVGAAAGAVIGGISSGGRGAARGAAIGGALGAAGGYIWSQNMQEQQRSMEAAAKGTGVEVSRTSDNQLKLEIPSDISFDVGKADIKPEMRPVLDKFAQNLANYQGTTVRIVGHTDSTGSDAINNPLSLNRAASTRDYLVSRNVAMSRISIDGRGEREPIADNNTAQGRAMNRRVEIFVAEPAPTSQQAPSR